jgi:CheY-like chemotaxis protein
MMQSDVASRAGATAVTLPLPTLSDVRVLIVEDDPDSRDATAALLELCGARATAVASVAEALSAVRREAPDVIVADIAMPLEDGFDLIRRLRDGSRPPIPMLALTAFATQGDQSRILAAGYDAYLAKPIDGTELVAVLQRLARRDS